MKPTLIWSLVALCGVVGGAVALHGGWRSFDFTLTPIRITRTVYVTNVESVVKVDHNEFQSDDAWSKPLTPVMPTADDGFYTHSDGHRLPINSYWAIKNSTGEPRVVTIGSGGTNGIVVNPLETLYITNFLISSNSLFINHAYATNNFHP